MYSTLLSIALLAAPALADLSISTPTLTQCKEASFSWQKGCGNYNVIVVPGSDLCGKAIHNFGDTTQTVMNWDKVALPAGTEVVLSVIDCDGTEGFSGKIKVQPSDDNSCVPKNLLDAAKPSAKPSASPSPSPAPSNPAPPVNPPTTPSNPETPANPPSNPSDPSNPADPSDPNSASPVAIGAANAGINPFADNGAASASVAAPLVALSALFGALATLL